MGDKHICYDRYSISGCSMFKQFFSAGEVIGQFVERVGEIGSKMKYHLGNHSIVHDWELYVLSTSEGTIACIVV